MIVGQQKSLYVLEEFLRHLVGETLDRSFFNRAIHALDPAVRSRVGGIGEPVLHAVFPTDSAEALPTRQKRMRLRSKLHAIIRQNGVPFGGQLVKGAAQKLSGHHPLGPWVQFGEDHLAGAVDDPKKVLAAFFGPDFGKIDV